jgi:Protein of unknown function (DUF4058)
MDAWRRSEYNRNCAGKQHRPKQKVSSVRSPFPGMDPFLEVSGDWRDFHTRFLNGCADSISDRLPENYVARIEEDFQILEYPEETEERRLPDVSISQTRRSRKAGARKAAVATLEPEFIPLVTTIVEDVKERWIEIRRRPDWTPVTIIEVLSPTNKSGHGYTEYLYKRVSLIARAIHLLELDFLVAGRRPPMGRPLRGVYHALVSRADRRPISDVFTWSVRDPLPIIPVPLLAPDADIALDLAAVFTTVYQRGRYERSIDYSIPLELPLNRKDRAWAQRQARTQGDTTA